VKVGSLSGLLAPQPMRRAASLSEQPESTKAKARRRRSSSRSPLPFGLGIGVQTEKQSTYIMGFFLEEVCYIIYTWLNSTVVSSAVYVVVVIGCLQTRSFYGFVVVVSGCFEIRATSVTPNLNTILPLRFDFKDCLKASLNSSSGYACSTTAESDPSATRSPSFW
jgi:hypothetical protein